MSPWGVDSVAPANREVRVPAAFLGSGDPGSGRLPLYNYVKRRMGGTPPAFWGRYLNIDPGQAARRLSAGRYTSQLTEGEREFLHDKRCKILLVYNGSHRRTRGYRAGRAAAERAASLAGRLGVAPHVILYADLENWQIDARWFRGWIDAMHDSPYRGGAYGRPVRVVENPASGHRLYGTAPRHIRSSWTRRRAEELINDARRPGYEPRRVVTREIWGDDLCEAMDDYREEMTDRVGSLTFGAVYNFDFYIWSNEPRRVFGNRARDATLTADDIPAEFVPAQPPCRSGARAVVWQYLQNCMWPRGGSRGLVDMNLANGPGVRGMW